MSTTIKPTVVIEISSPDKSLAEEMYRNIFGTLNTEDLDSRIPGIPIHEPITWHHYEKQFASLFRDVGERGGNFISPGFITAPLLERHAMDSDKGPGGDTFWADFQEYTSQLNIWKNLGVRIVHLHVRSSEKEKFKIQRMAYSLIYSWQVHNPANPKQRESAEKDWIICDVETDPASIYQKIQDVLIRQ